MKQKSVTVPFSAPSILEKSAEYDCADLKLDSVEYVIREFKQNGGDDSNRQSSASFVDSKCDTGAAASPTPQPYNVTVNKLKPATEYRVKLRANYNTGDSVETEEKSFQTLPYTGINCLQLYYSAYFFQNYSLFLQRNRICAFSVVFSLAISLR